MAPMSVIPLPDKPAVVNRASVTICGLALGKSTLTPRSPFDRTHSPISWRDKTVSARLHPPTLPSHVQPLVQHLEWYSLQYRWPRKIAGVVLPRLTKMPPI